MGLDIIDGWVVSAIDGEELFESVKKESEDALTRVKDGLCLSQKRREIQFDSGIRRGADVVKALALGASAVLLGRPYAYGLALAGEQGVQQVIRNLIVIWI